MIPSVTQVLAPFSRLDRVRPAVLEAASERGVAVHRLCVGIAQRLFVRVPPSLAGYVNSFRRWWPVVEELIAAEEKMTSPLGYMGHPDLVVRIRGDRALTVVDLKTPLTTGKTWAAQTAAYAHMCPGVERNIGLRLRPSGGRPIVDDFTKTRARDFAAFLNCLGAWRYFNG